MGEIPAYPCVPVFLPGASKQYTWEEARTPPEQHLRTAHQQRTKFWHLVEGLLSWHWITDRFTDCFYTGFGQKMKVRQFRGRGKEIKRQRTLDCRQCFPWCCQPCCLLIVWTPQHTHTDTEHSVVKSLSEIRLTSSVYLTSFEEARVQTHAHTHAQQTVPLGQSAT